MKAQLVKRQDRFDLYNESDGSKIASTLPNPMGKLSLKNCQAIENGYDLDELALSYVSDHLTKGTDEYHNSQIDFKEGFQKALEILGDKKFGVNEVVELCKILISNPFEKCGKTYQELTDSYIQSLQHVEWDVEIEMEQYVKYVPKSLATVFPTGGVRPKLDADKCIILKRK